MPKTKISEFSATPANNTDIDSINISEGCAPSGINDAIRELMAQLKDFQTGAVGDSFNGPVGTTTAAAGAFTTLSASGNVTLSGGTANGVAYLNGSKVVTSGSALVFDGTNLGLGGAATSFGAGFPTLTMLATSGAGIFQSKNTAGDTRLYANTDGDAYLGSWANTSLRMYTNSTLKATLNTSGNLGLGVTPSAWSTGKAIEVGRVGNAIWNLDSNETYFLSNAYFNSGFKYGATGTATQYLQFSGQHRWYNAPSGTAGDAITFTQAMTLDASGNLGVGETSPTSRLHVAFTSNSVDNVLQIQQKGNNTASGITLAANDNNGAGYNFIRSLTTGGTTHWQISGGVATSTMAFSTGGTERARIDSSGNLLIATTTSSLTSGDGFVFTADANNSGAKTGYSGNSQSCWNMYSTGASAYRFYVGWGGTVYATSTSISAISDQTLKTNIRDLETGLTEVMALKPRRFDWINDDATNVAGFIAQEVEQILPELVSDYEYSEGVTKKSLKMGDILPTLVKAIQEQQAIIESLKARLDAANL